MAIRRLQFLFLFLIVTVGEGRSDDGPVRRLRAGAATSNITPRIGEPVIGGFVPYPSKHIHDELHVRCLVLDDGETTVVLAVCDLLGIHRVVSEEARRLISERHGIPRENVLISATHTHSAASALGSDRLEPDQRPDEYQTFVAQRILDAVTRAVNNKREAQIAFGSVDVPEHLFNRRWYMRPGTVPPNPFGQTDLVKMNPPGGSPNLTEPAGPIDPAVSVISVRDDSGRPISVFAAYSLHYVGGTGAADVSADYYGYFCERLRELMEKETGSGNGTRSAESSPLTRVPLPDRAPFVGLMANGTSGDINNINFRMPRASKPPYEQMQYVAYDVAKKVHELTRSLTYESSPQLAARYREPEIRWRRPTEKQMSWAQETIAAGPASPSDLSYIYAQRTMKLAAYPELTKIPVQIIRIGDICIGTMPCEVFCEIGLEFRDRSPVKNSFMVELAHGYFGYLPTPRHFELGGYETWIGTNRLEATASDKLLSELLQMADEVVQP